MQGKWSRPSSAATLGVRDGEVERTVQRCHAGGERCRGGGSMVPKARVAKQRSVSARPELFSYSFDDSKRPILGRLASRFDAMPQGKLYGNKDNFRTQKVLIAAKLGNSDVQLAGEHPPSDKFPLGITPAFEGDVNLFGAESIAVHLAGCSSVAPENCAEVVQWMQWAEGSLLPTVLGYVLPSVSAANIDKKVVDTYKAELFAQLMHLNEILLNKTYLVGERLSLADISVALDLLPAFQHVLDATIRKKFGNVTRWFQTVVHHPTVKEVVSEVLLCEKVSHFNNETFQEISSRRAKNVPKKDGKDGHKKKRSMRSRLQNLRRLKWMMMLMTPL
ncbi:Elongation factor 1-gamma [Parelaphostrongylus tenuis]|uniref:eEF-1B gamma n=1 Tax=Parelaphostrongylus tenuis TaxID=148309 RepID=A0AAD5MZI7_PARTN|nr:Elongation factor 1-gamma [Parelaphostrongylus tenuis]